MILARASIHSACLLYQPLPLAGWARCDGVFTGVPYHKSATRHHDTIAILVICTLVDINDRNGNAQFVNNIFYCGIINYSYTDLHICLCNILIWKDKLVGSACFCGYVVFLGTLHVTVVNATVVNISWTNETSYSDNSSDVWQQNSSIYTIQLR